MSETTDVLTARELQSLRNLGGDAERAAAEITRLRAALAQAGAGREPMFYVRLVADGRYYEGPVHANSVGGKMLRDERPGEWTPLYPHPAPAQREPLSDAEVMDLRVFVGAGPATHFDKLAFARAIERAHGITASSNKRVPNGANDAGQTAAP